MMTTDDRTVAVLLDRYGRLYAAEAGIRLADTPVPLYELLVLATLLSARISADIAVAAARELFAAGYRSPKAMAEAGWQDRVDALGRGHYRRYDERTATMLGDSAGLLTDRWRGDLRRLRAEAAGQTAAMTSLLTSFPGIGQVGASIFLREIQDIWPEVCPYVDVMTTRGARKVGLTAQPDELAKVLAASGEPARLAAALVRVGISDRAAGDVVTRVARER
jgi:endonuclease III